MQSSEHISAESGSSEKEQLGVDLLLTWQVAEREHASVRSVERWIEKGLPADPATREQIGQLFSQGLLRAIPSHQTIYLIRRSDLYLIPKIRAYPTGTTRPLRGKKTGAGEGQR